MTMKKMISLALAACMALALAAPVAAATVPKQEEVALINTTNENRPNHILPIFSDRDVYERGDLR